MSTAPTSRRPERADVGGRWSVVPEASETHFHVRDKLVTTVHGSMTVEDGGAVITEGGDILEAWITVSVTGIATGNTHRDRDLRKPRFLDAAGHPSIRVSVENPIRTPSGWTGRGEVVVRGRQAPIDLSAESTVTPDGEIRVKVSGRLDRRPLEIAVPTFIFGRFLDLDATITCRRTTRPADRPESGPGTATHPARTGV